MRIAYFDCPTGIAGNMILGALIDAGLDLSYLKKELKKLGNLRINFAVSKLRGNRDAVPAGRQVQSQVSERFGTHIQVKIPKGEKPRNLSDILKLINSSKLSKNVKARGSEIFKRLAEAEAKVHGVPINKIHFHEVGAIDAIVDIVGACIGTEKLGIEKIYCSPLPHGKGTIKCAHGILPNPGPATVELLKGIPTYGTNIYKELVTPTGAAIISTLAESFGDCPRIKVSEIGYGAGNFDLPMPNLLRVFIGEAEMPTEKDAILQIETNIDDMEPKLYDQAIAKIMKTGALDASIHPIRMKKKREAIKLEVLCRPKDKDKILDTIFSETTTIGTRVYLLKRENLRREIRHGKKISYLGKEIKRVKPEPH